MCGGAAVDPNNSLPPPVEAVEGNPTWTISSHLRGKGNYGRETSCSLSRAFSETLWRGMGMAGDGEESVTPSGEKRNGKRTPRRLTAKFHTPEIEK